jgi:SAM-dependent MidA family methyltransferase
MADLDPISGAFISNEFVDAMPVHVVEYRNGRWSELLVENSGQNFRFVPSRVEAPELAQALETAARQSRVIDFESLKAL